MNLIIDLCQEMYFPIDLDNFRAHDLTFAIRIRIAFLIFGEIDIGDLAVVAKGHHASGRIDINTLIPLQS